MGLSAHPRSYIVSLGQQASLSTTYAGLLRGLGSGNPGVPSLASRSCSSRPRSVCWRRYHAVAPHAAMITNAMKQEPTTSAWQLMRAHNGRLSPPDAARPANTCVRYLL